MVSYQSQNTFLHYIKIAVQWALVLMLFYQAHLGLRDSDKATFENRVVEGLKFLEGNHPGHRVYVIDSLGIDRKNCTRE